MRSTFYGLEITTKGLSVSQKGLDITGHNIANVNTEGYSRQRLTQAAVDPFGTRGFFAPIEKGIVGGGSVIQTLDQIRDVFLDRQVRNENCIMGEWNIKYNALYYVEDLFKTNTGADISSSLDSFFAAINDIQKDPAEKELRVLVKQEGIKLCETLKHARSQLTQLREQQDDAINVTVGRINEIARSIADLNEQIYKFELSGERANDLRDKRNLLVDQLSSVVDVTYNENAITREFSVRIGKDNMILVDHFGGTEANPRGAYTLATDRTEPDYDGTPQVLHSITWQDGPNFGRPLTVNDLSTGELKGYLDMRDGDHSENVGLVYIIEQLDELAAGIIANINRVHSLGYNFPQDGSPSENGIVFFTGENARNMEVNELITANVFNIAISDQPITGGDFEGNAEVAIQLSQLYNSIELTGIGSFKGFLNGILGLISVEASHSKNMVESQSVLLESIGMQRMAVMGVSLDEELTNMLRFEKAYSAAARVLTAMDESLDVLINRTGVVGR